MKTPTCRRRVPFRIYPFALLICFLGSGCNLFGPKASDKIDKHPPPVASGDKPTPEKVVKYLNDQADLMTSIEAREVSIDVKSPAGSVTLDGSLSCQKPRSMKLVGRKLGMQQVVVGSNNDRFWFYIRQQDTLFHCSYSDFEKGAELPYPFQPEWVVDALGMSRVGDPGAARVEADKQYCKLIEDTTVRGQKAKKVTLFYSGTTHGTQPQVISRTVYDASDRVIFRATTQKVNRRPVEQAGHGPREVVVPEIIKLEWPAQDTTMVIDLDRARVNTAISAEAFQMPHLGNRQIDLGRDQPTGRVVPARYR